MSPFNGQELYNLCNPAHPGCSPALIGEPFFRLGETEASTYNTRPEKQFTLWSGRGLWCGPRLPNVCISPPNSDYSRSPAGTGTGAVNNSDSTKVGTLGSGHNSSPMQAAMAPSTAQGPALTGGGGDIPPTPRAPGSMGLARERMNLSAGGLPQNVINTIQSARALSTRTLYSCKWRVFEEWCEKSHVVAFQASVSDILSFLQEMLDRGRAFSTVNVYLAAILACHVGFEGTSVGSHPLITRFMKGARRLHPVTKPLVPSWDLVLVLESLSQPPFEPLEGVDMKFVSLKTALLLALATAKRVSDMHAFSVHPECIRFDADNMRVVLRPNPTFVPKNPRMECVPVELEAFHPPPFASQEHQRLHSLCPVRALSVYVERSRLFRKANQLFVSWATQHIGKPITKQRLSHWIVEAIQLTYSSRGQRPPEGLRAHSTRGTSTSWALFKGLSIQDICAAASWASPSTFARFYRLDVTAPPLAHAVLSVNSR